MHISQQLQSSIINMTMNKSLESGGPSVPLNHHSELTHYWFCYGALPTKRGPKQEFLKTVSLSA